MTSSGKPNPPDDFDQLVKRLQQDFSDMTRQFQVGAKYLLDFPAEVPIASMRTIARQAKVQPATLVRLAQSLGFDGWADMKEIFVRAFRQSPGMYASQAKKVVRSRSRGAMVSQTLAAQAANLGMIEGRNAQDLARAVSLLSAASWVHVAGFRSCFAPAFTLHYLYRLFRPSVTMLRGDAGTLEMELRAVTENDAIVVMSFAPYSQETRRVTDAAQEIGCKVLAITDSVVAPIAQHADCTLIVSTTTPSFFPSVTSFVAMVELLVEQLLAKKGMQAVSGIELAEAQLHASGAYIVPK
jgi:DNA-binding MurR/RpiR family transcriptional regulator